MRHCRRRVHVLHIPTEIRVSGVVGVRLFDRLLLELRGGADIAAGKRVKMRGVGVGVRHGIRNHGLRKLRLARAVLFGAEARLLASGFLELLGEPLRALLADPLDDPVDFVRGSGVLVRVAQRVDGGGQTGHRVRERRIPLEFAGGAHKCAELRLRADRTGQMGRVRADVGGHVLVERAAVLCGLLGDRRFGERTLLVTQRGECGDQFGVCAVGALRGRIIVDRRGQAPGLRGERAQHIGIVVGRIGG